MSEGRSWNPLNDMSLGTLVPGVGLDDGNAGRRELGGVTPESVTRRIENVATMPDLRGEPARE